MRRPSPALLLSIAALVVALGGTAVAAKKYVITSTKQISPKVLAQLRGRSGPVGADGLPGPRGTDGAPGAPGAEGPAGPSSIVSATRTKYDNFTIGPVAELTALPKGAWLVVASLTAVGSTSDLTCGVEGHPGATVGLSQTAAAALTTSAAIDLPAPANVRVLCNTAAPASLKSIRLYAIRTGELDRRSLD
jgi:hypothetical protein